MTTAGVHHPPSSSPSSSKALLAQPSLKKVPPSLTSTALASSLASTLSTISSTPPTTTSTTASPSVSAYSHSDPTLHLPLSRFPSCLLQNNFPWRDHPPAKGPTGKSPGVQKSSSFTPSSSSLYALSLRNKSHGSPSSYAVVGNRKGISFKLNSTPKRKTRLSHPFIESCRAMLRHGKRTNLSVHSAPTTRSLPSTFTTLAAGSDVPKLPSSFNNIQDQCLDATRPPLLPQGHALIPEIANTAAPAAPTPTLPPRPPTQPITPPLSASTAKIATSSPIQTKPQAIATDTIVDESASEITHTLHSNLINNQDVNTSSFPELDPTLLLDNEDSLSYLCDEVSDMEWDLPSLLPHEFPKDLDDEEIEMNKDFNPHLGRLPDEGQPFDISMDVMGDSEGLHPQLAAFLDASPRVEKSSLEREEEIEQAHFLDEDEEFFGDPCFGLDYDGTSPTLSSNCTLSATPSHFSSSTLECPSLSRLGDKLGKPCAYLCNNNDELEGDSI